MLSLPFGFFVLIVTFSYLMLGEKASIFFNLHSAALVLLGTCGILAVSAPFRDIGSLFSSILNFLRPIKSERDVHNQIKAVSQNKMVALGDDAHPLIKIAQELWNQGVDYKQFPTLLQQKMEHSVRKGEASVAILRNLAKYPPALGMTGTVLGLSSLFSELTPGSKANIGPALGIALTATFYGLILANAVIMPLADRLQVTHLNRTRRMEEIFLGLVAIHRDEPLLALGEELHAKAA